MRVKGEFGSTVSGISTLMRFLFSFFFLRFYLFIFREGKGGTKRGRETSVCGCRLPHPLLGTWPATQACALTGNQTSDPLVHRLALSPLSHTSQGSTLMRFKATDNTISSGMGALRDML